jgi:hypothetical protein
MISRLGRLFIASAVLSTFAGFPPAAPAALNDLCADRVCRDHPLPVRPLTSEVLLGTWTIASWVHRAVIGEGQLVVQQQVDPGLYLGELTVRSLIGRSSAVQRMKIRVRGNTVTMTGSIEHMVGFWDADSLSLVWDGSTLSGFSIDSRGVGGRVVFSRGSNLARAREA